MKCTAVRDDNAYPAGIEVSDARMTCLQDRVLERDPFHGEWNSRVPARPPARPGTGARPRTPRPRPARCPEPPALTGMQLDDLESVAAALEILFAACREQQNYTHRGGRRVNAVRNGGAPSRNRRLDVTDHILAARLRGHLNLPTRAIGVLLGVDPATISHATILTAELLASARVPLPATAPPPAVLPRTPAALLQYAAAAGSTLTIPETARPCQNTSNHASGNHDTPGLNNRQGLFAEDAPGKHRRPGRGTSSVTADPAAAQPPPIEPGVKPHVRKTGAVPFRRPSVAQPPPIEPGVKPHVRKTGAVPCRRPSVAQPPPIEPGVKPHVR